jgi:hypothetical protein
MVTALAFYEGKTLAEFELVGLTTNAELIATVVELMQTTDPHVLAAMTPVTRQRQKLRVVTDHQGA